MKIPEGTKPLVMDKQSYKRAKKRKKMIYVAESPTIPENLQAEEKVYVTRPDGKKAKRRTVKQVYSAQELAQFDEKQKKLLRPKDAVLDENSVGVRLKHRPVVLRGLRHTLLVLLIFVALIAAFLVYLGEGTTRLMQAFRWEPEFCTEIGSFTGSVEYGEVPEEMSALVWNPDLTLRKVFVDGFALYECFRDDGTEKPMIICLPNGGGFKEDYADEAVYFADMGYYALSVDYAGNGESRDNLRIFTDGVNENQIRMLNTLIEYYNGVEQADATDFSLTGPSMGGIIATHYGMYGKYKPYALIFESTQVYSKTITDFYPERLLDIYIIGAIGEEDQPESVDAQRYLEQILKDLGGTKATFQYYPGLGHEDLKPEYYEARDELLLRHIEERAGN